MCQVDEPVEDNSEAQYKYIATYQYQEIIIYCSQRIDNTNRYTNEEISHFLYRHYHRTITHDREDSKQTECETYFNFSSAEQETDKKVQAVEQEKGKKEILVSMPWVIDQSHQDEHRQDIDAKPHEQFHETEPNIFTIKQVVR
jgi:hypothetical protein